MSKIQILTVGDIEHIAHVFAQETMEWNEPIPDFRTRYGGVLESCLHVPFQTSSRRTLYRGLVGKAAVLFYLMIKNHPFQNGNKRIAITTLLVFLYRNGKWIEVNNETLYRFATWVASSDPTVKDATIQAIQIFLKKYLSDRRSV